MINLAIDAMGGDHAPEEIVKGAILAVQKCGDICISLVGIPEKIEPLLKGKIYEAVGAHIKVVPATEIIEAGDHPVESVRTKKDSSMMVGLKLVRDENAAAFISGGNSGALMVGAQTLVGRQKNVARAPFAHMLPHSQGTSLLLDCGANVDVRPEHLLCFARLGQEYLRSITGIVNPRVGLVNIGAEETKGNSQTIEAYQMLKNEEGINFIGNVEPTDITLGKADILVCDGFTGNIIIKLYEGLGKLLLETMKKGLTASTAAKVGGILAKKSLKEQFKSFDSRNYGGAPILGLKGLVIKVHGNAQAKEYCNAIQQCFDILNEKGENHGI